MRDIMIDQDPDAPETGHAPAPTADGETGGADDVEFVRRSFYLPRPLVERLEEWARESDGDSSRILVDALAEHLAGTDEAAPAEPSREAEEGPETGEPEAPAPAPPDFSEVALTAEAHDLAESLHSRLRLLGDVSLDQTLVRDTLESVAQVIEDRDAFTDGHAGGVAALSRGVAEAMDLPAEDILAIELGGLVHEVGKLAVPRSILGKKGKLTASERETIRRYPEVAAELLRSVPALRPLEQTVMYHQERWDGSGYPEGLSGDAIPLGAQIVGIADAYHSLTSSRSYRPALDSDQARNIVREASGRLWNPKVARALIRHLQSRR